MIAVGGDVGVVGYISGMDDVNWTSQVDEAWWMALTYDEFAAAIIKLIAPRSAGTHTHTHTYTLVHTRLVQSLTQSPEE